MTRTPYFLCTIWSPANKFSAHLASICSTPVYSACHHSAMICSYPGLLGYRELPLISFSRPRGKWRKRKRMNLVHTFSSEDTQLSITTVKTSQLNFKHGRSDNYVWVKNPHFQNEAKCTTFLVKMSFICMKVKSHFHTKGCALNLVLIQRPGVTRKWLLV